MKSYLWMVLVLIAVQSPLVGADEKAAAAAKEVQMLQGTWTVVSSEQNGEKRTDLEAVNKMRLTIKGEAWTLEYHNNTKDRHVARIKLDPNQKPKVIDLMYSEGLLAGHGMPAIYELNKDVLKVCFADETGSRPTNFNSKEGPGGRWLLVLKRQK